MKELKEMTYEAPEFTLLDLKAVYGDVSEQTSPITEPEENDPSVIEED